MNTIQKRKILTRIRDLESDLDALRRARLDLATSEYVSVTLASSGGSKSFSRYNPSQLTQIIQSLQEELKQYRLMLQGGTSGVPGQIVTVYSY